MWDELAMLGPRMKRSDDSLEALRRVRAQDVERAAVAVARAESAVVEAAARLQTARAFAVEEAGSRARTLAEEVGRGGAVRAQDVAQRMEWLAATDARVAAAEAAAHAHEQALRGAEVDVASRKESLAAAHAGERALAAHFEAQARVEARARERGEEDDALDAHLARRS